MIPRDKACSPCILGIYVWCCRFSRLKFGGIFYEIEINKRKEKCYIHTHTHTPFETLLKSYNKMKHLNGKSCNIIYSMYINTREIVNVKHLNIKRETEYYINISFYNMYRTNYVW